MHYLKYAESSIIATLYTERYGRQSFIINSVRKSKPKFPASFFLPLSLLEIDMYYKSGRDLQRIRDINSLQHFHSLPFQIKKSTIALFISELLYKSLKEEEANPRLFEFLINAIQLLDLKEDGIENFHLVFLIQYFKFLGIYPFFPLNEDLLIQQPMFVLPSEMNLEEKEGLEKLSHCSLAELEKIKLSSHIRNYLLEKIIHYYEFNFEQITWIRSLKTLKEVFH